ncbi:hypothetical protein CLOM_g17336 [Closterium sp. NIES-68]|nr:hypothetical protein CLOM_g17336 [Closterium sp. NIES-68]GJP73158.1 hypothetical protein CLOP_g3896 [Closterium sp. NIES-67]
MVQQGTRSSSLQDCHRPVPPPFLTKTYQLVDDSSTDEVVSWGSELVTFVVWKPMEFARDLLPNYFKHNNFSSFVRQLNTYGFRKVAPTRWEFGNDYFKKGEFRLLCEIQRRKAFVPTISSHIPQPGPSKAPEPMKDVCAADEIERLQSENALLSSELKRMQRLYYDAISLLQQASQPLAHSAHGSTSLWYPRPPVPVFDAQGGSSSHPGPGNSPPHPYAPSSSSFISLAPMISTSSVEVKSGSPSESDAKAVREQVLEAALADMRHRVATFSKTSGFRPVVPVAVVSSDPRTSSPASSVIDEALSLHVQDSRAAGDCESTDSETPSTEDASIVGRKRASPDCSASIADEAGVHIWGKKQDL